MSYDHLFDLPTDPVATMVQRLHLSPDQFAGKVALVTGSARGIGKQTAIGLAALGAQTVVLDKNPNGQTVADFIQQQGHTAIFIHCDVADFDQLRAAFAQIEGTLGPVDILMNNAVHFSIDAFSDMPIEEWELHQKTNIGAAVLATKLALPGMQQRGSGTVLNMVALEGMAYAAAMSASKVAMRSLLFSLASELGKNSPITIMGFAPGLVATPLIADVFVKYCQRVAIDFEDYVLQLGHNPGYAGMMPPEHCAASLIHALANASDYHGLIADPFHTLEKYGIIDTGKQFFSGHRLQPELGEGVSENVTRLREYIAEITELNGHIESKIQKRTAEISKEKELIMRLMQELRQRNQEQVTTARQLQDQKDRLEVINAELRKFAYVVSHDLKTPLRGIANLTTFLRMDLEDNIEETTSQNLQLLENRVRRMEKLINGILEYSRAGGIHTRQVEIDLNVLLAEVVDMVNAPEGFHIQVADEFPVLMGNRTAFAQIFQNLVGNAVKYHHQQTGHIHLGHSRKGENWEFWVQDDGPGIAPEYHQKIFNIFQTLRPKDEIDGTGLGLAIVKKTIEESGGKIWVESSPGAGSVFRFSIPAEKVMEATSVMP